MRVVSGLLAVGLVVAVSAFATPRGDFQSFLAHFEAATTRFLNGDATPLVLSGAASIVLGAAQAGFDLLRAFA